MDNPSILKLVLMMAPTRVLLCHILLKLVLMMAPTRVRLCHILVVRLCVTTNKQIMMCMVSIVQGWCTSLHALEDCPQCVDGFRQRFAPPCPYFGALDAFLCQETNWVSALWTLASCA